MTIFIKCGNIWQYLVGNVMKTRMNGFALWEYKYRD